MPLANSVLLAPQWKDEVIHEPGSAGGHQRTGRHQKDAADDRSVKHLESEEVHSPAKEQAGRLERNHLPHGVPVACHFALLPAPILVASVVGVTP